MEICSPSFITFVGMYALIWWCIEHLTSIFEYTVNSLLPYFKFQKPKTLQQEYGQWAVVTGATDGIGKQYAIELAKRGMNICLISRSEAKLINVASEIEKSHKVDTKYIVVDFSKDFSIYEDIKSQLQTLDIGILVNNVGMLHDIPEKFENLSEETLLKMINVNVGAITFMTKMVIPIMKAKRRGLILNITSGSQYQPLPMAAIYGATKSYSRSLSVALKEELSEFNIKVHIVAPALVNTNMTHFALVLNVGNIIFPDAETFVQAAIKTLGKCSETSGYWLHCLQFTIFTTLPECVRIFISNEAFKKFRRDYLEKSK